MIYFYFDLNKIRFKCEGLLRIKISLNFRAEFLFIDKLDQCNCACCVRYLFVKVFLFMFLDCYYCLHCVWNMLIHTKLLQMISPKS